MTKNAATTGGCIVAECPAGRASWLGVCAGHWDRLPRELRDEWWRAWADDGRVKEWTAARRRAVAFFGPDAP